MKLKFKFALSIVLLGSILILIVGYSYYSINKTSIIKQVFENNNKNTAFISKSIENDLLDLVLLTKTIASSDVVKNSLIASNSEYSLLTATARKKVINNLNNEWMNTNDLNSPFIKNRIDNPVGSFLTAQKKTSPNLYGEIFLTNKYGVMISTTGKLTTLAHYKKYWWQEAFNDGKGSVYLDDRGFDASVDGYVLGVVVPIYDKAGKIIGILKSNYNISSIFNNSVGSFHDLNSTGENYIVRTLGLIVGCRTCAPSSSMPAEIIPYIKKKTALNMEINIDGTANFLTIKPINLTYKSDDLRFGGKYESIAHSKGNLGEGWSIVHIVDKDLALKELNSNLENFLAIGFGMLAFLALLSLFIGDFLSKPFRELNTYIGEVGNGKLIKKDLKVTDDEIGALTVSFNKLIDHLNSTLISKEKLEDEKEVAQKYSNELILSGQIFKNSIENAPIPIIIHAEDGTVLNISKKWTELTLYTKADLPTIFDWIKKAYGINGKKAVEVIKTAYNSTETRHNGEFVVTTKDGRKLTWDFNAGYIGNLPDGKAIFMSVAIDVTEKIIAKKEIEFLSYNDQLTGLYNRRFFEEELKRLDNPKNLPISIIMGDVNGLKITNDAFGHLAGDKLLKIIGKIILKSIKENDIAVRWGGDEFVILLPNTGEDGAKAVINRIKGKIKETPFEFGILSVALGSDTKKEESEDINETFVISEKLMYQNKLLKSDSIRSQTIKKIMDTLFEKSLDIKDHSMRVSKLAGLLAEKMGLSKVRINDIKAMGLVHDIGKIGIDLNILNKTSALTEVERKIMQQHPLSGSKMLNSAREYSRLSTGALYHHERIDGTGYPDGIAGNKIPVEAKIIAVVDAFDVMTSKRAYKLTTLSLEDAITELKKHSGTQFDEKVVDIFINKVLRNT